MAREVKKITLSKENAGRTRFITNKSLKERGTGSDSIKHGHALRLDGRTKRGQSTHTFHSTPGVIILTVPQSNLQKT